MKSLGTRRARFRTGFTLIELTVALSIAVVVMGLVVVRVEGWSSKQTLRTTARRLGNTIRTFREKARLEETGYLLTLNLDKNDYKIEPLYKNPLSYGRKTLRTGSLPGGQSFGKVLMGEIELQTPVAIPFTERGVLPELSVTIVNGHGEEVTLTLGALTNEVTYEESTDEESKK